MTGTDDFVSLAGSLITVAGTVYLVGETGKLIKNSMQPTKTKNRRKKNSEWEFDFGI